MNFATEATSMDDVRALASVESTWLGEAATAVFYGQFVCAAYEMGEGPATLPPPPAPPLPDGYEIIAVIYMTDFVFEADKNPTHYGLLAANAAGHNVLAIRGTVGWKEWWADLTSLHMVDCVFKDSPQVYGQVGFGFLELYNTLHPISRAERQPDQREMTLEAQRSTSFAAAVHGIIKDHALKRGSLVSSQPTVDVVGHSLGSALATLYTLDRHSGPNNFPAGKLCTFASPMVGDGAFKAAFGSDFLKGDPDRSWRFYISSDIVPMVPPSWMGFVPVDDGIALKLSWSTSWWWPPCAHSLSSYMHVLDPSWPLPSACTGSSDPDRCTPQTASTLVAEV